MTVPWTSDHLGDADWDGYQPDIQTAAEEYAWATLRYLTGGRVGHGTVRLRPCAARCLPVGGYTATGPGWYPTIRDGEWYNSACGHNPASCSCGELSEVIFPGEVADVALVTVDGAPLAEWTDYRLDNRSRLLRIGGTWPTCQDMTLAWDAVGAFTIDYVPGVNPTGAGLVAAGVLAVDFQEGYFPNNVTGMLAVDAYVFSLNPAGLRKPAQIWSPDLPAYRTQPYVLD
jgi:hypothetical protein